jgi:hypothetical protein
VERKLEMNHNVGMLYGKLRSNDKYYAAGEKEVTVEKEEDWSRSSIHLQFSAYPKFSSAVNLIQIFWIVSEDHFLKLIIK